MKKYLIFFILYFFFNSLGLPRGLLYTTLLAPFFFLWLTLNNKIKWAFYFVLASAPWLTAHYLLNESIQWENYWVSYFLIFGIFLTCAAFILSLQKISDLDNLFRKLIFLNFLLTIIGIGLRFTQYSDLMWGTDIVTLGSSMLSRFKMFTYEPSYYSRIVLPFALYTFWRFAIKPSIHNFIYLFSTTLPLAISFSFGAIGGAIGSLIFIHLIHLYHLVKKKYFYAILAGAIILCIYLISTENIINLRINNFLSGKDASANLRISSLAFGFEIAKETNLFWGAGFGQSKIFGWNIIPSWAIDSTGSLRLTSIMAYAAAEYGLIGFILMLLVEFYLFIKTQVWKNYFRFSLFCFLFIYQFTGSYMTDLVIYVSWILCFRQIFPQFNIRPYFLHPYGSKRLKFRSHSMQL